MTKSDDFMSWFNQTIKEVKDKQKDQPKEKPTFYDKYKLYFEWQKEKESNENDISRKT